MSDTTESTMSFDLPAELEASLATAPRLERLTVEGVRTALTMKDNVKGGLKIAGAMNQPFNLSD